LQIWWKIFLQRYQKLQNAHGIRIYLKIIKVPKIKLSKEKAEIFHTFMMKGMFFCKRGRQDIQPGVTYLGTRVHNPDECDWRKLIQIIDFLKATIDVILRMTIDDTKSIKWNFDAAFAVHKDFKVIPVL
jgi:hypothetical protein